MSIVLVQVLVGFQDFQLSFLIETLSEACKFGRTSSSYFLCLHVLLFITVISPFAEFLCNLSRSTVFRGRPIGWTVHLLYRSTTLSLDQIASTKPSQKLVLSMEQNVRSSHTGKSIE